MPRKWLITVTEFPPLQERAYQCRVTQMGRGPDGGSIKVTMMNLDPEHEGREHVLVLSATKVHTAGRTAAFFAACGIVVAVGAKIDPEEATGKVILVRFTATANGAFEPTAFEPCQEKPQ